MKGEKGTCSVGKGPNLVRKTKFDTKKNAQEACDFHVGMGFVQPDCIVYECKVCDMWHFGNPAQAKLYEN